MESVQFTTADGITLNGDIADPAGAPTGGIVVCHPHPLYGGNRQNPMVAALFEALPAAGFATVRFDFRSEHDRGVAEQLDLIAALDLLAHRNDVPLGVVGYSFGAIVALDTIDERIMRRVAIAPPLSMKRTLPPGERTLVLTPRHDQYCPPDVSEPIVSAWPHAEFAVIESTDHFLAGATRGVADRVIAWLTTDIEA